VLHAISGLSRTARLDLAARGAHIGYEVSGFDISERNIRATERWLSVLKT